MSAKRFLDAVGHIDDELVAEFVEREMEMKPSPTLIRARRLWWVPIPAVAACLALMMLLHHLIPVLLSHPFDHPVGEELEAFLLSPWTPPALGEDVPIVEVPAERQLPYDVQHNGIPSSWYVKASGSGIDSLGHDLYHTEYLPIYGKTPQQGRDLFEPFVKRMLPILRELTTVTDTSYTVYAMDNGYEFPGQFATVGGDAYIPYLYLSKNDYSSPQMQITAELIKPEVFPTIPKGLGEEEILNTLSDTVAYLESVFGIRFETQSVWDMHNTFVLQLAVIDEVRQDFPRELAVSYSHFLALYFSYFPKEGCFRFYYLTYTDDEDTVNNSSPDMVGKARMLTIAEAQELIAKGYVYGGHGCTLCRAEESELSFDEYDKVTLTYTGEYAGEYGWYVPFYTFYKKSNAYGGQYYTVIVPAVELSGLEDYFAEQTVVHDHTK
jgi:hypothetical protein